MVSGEKYYHGYGSSNPRTNSLFLAGNLIERCRYTAENFENASPDQIVCASEPIDISALPIDPLLPSIAEQSLVGRYSVATNYSPAFCKSLIAEFSEVGVTREFLEVPREAQRFFQPAGADRDTPSASVDQFDLGNSGSMDTVIQFTGEEKLFYGSVHFYRRGIVPESEIRTLLDQRRQITSGNYVERARELGWSTIVDAPDLRTRWTLLRLSGTTFLLKQDSYGSDATLYRPETYGPQLPPSLESICEYRMMQEPF